MMKFKGERHPILESTQLLLKERWEADAGLPHGYYVLADEQTTGRGRSGNAWESLPGNLHGSILLRDLPFSGAQITWTPLWVSACLFRALCELGVDDQRIHLKWPNDLWVDRQDKIAGILCEKRGDCLIAGVGVNLANAPQGAGMVPGVNLSPDVVLLRLLDQLSRTDTVQDLKAFYERHALFNPGEVIEWTQDSAGGTKMSGVLVGLGFHGELLVDVGGNTTLLFTENVQAVRLK